MSEWGTVEAHGRVDCRWRKDSSLGTTPKDFGTAHGGVESRGGDRLAGWLAATSSHCAPPTVHSQFIYGGQSFGRGGRCGATIIFSLTTSTLLSSLPSPPFRYCLSHSQDRGRALSIPFLLRSPCLAHCLPSHRAPHAVPTSHSPLPLLAVNRRRTTTAQRRLRIRQRGGSEKRKLVSAITARVSSHTYTHTLVLFSLCVAAPHKSRDQRTAKHAPRICNNLSHRWG